MRTGKRREAGTLAANSGRSLPSIFNVLDRRDCRAENITKFEISNWRIFWSWLSHRDTDAFEKGIRRMCIQFKSWNPPQFLLEKLYVCASRALAVSAARHHNNSSLIHVNCINKQYTVYIYWQGDILSVQMRYGDEMLLI